MDILSQIGICVPSIMAATTLLTSVINNALNVTNNNWKHAISWIVAVIAGIGLVFSGTFEFGYGNWDYLVGGLFGLFAGGASNGWYDWKSIQSIVDAFGALFKKKEPENIA